MPSNILELKVRNMKPWRSLDIKFIMILKMQHKDIYSLMKLKFCPYKVIQKMMKDTEIIRHFKPVRQGVSLSVSIGSKSQPINFDKW